VLLRTTGGFISNGFDGPDFVLYDNGVAIFHVEATPNFAPAYGTVQLSPEERDSLHHAVAETLESLGRHYEPWQMSDALRYYFDVLVDGAYERTEVVGGLWPTALWRQYLPRPLVQLYDELSHFTQSNAVPWLPPNVEVLLWPLVPGGYDCDSVVPVPWPAEWSHAVEHTTDGRPLVRIPTADLRHLARLWSRFGPYACHPLQLGGQSWTFGYRYPFPAEEQWPALY
jgi:hypothetical protein